MLKAAARKLLGPAVPYVRTARQLVRTVSASFGQYPRKCPVCNFHGRFLAVIHLPEIFRFDALCPRCASLPRSRLLWLTITSHDLIGRTERVIHFAPEKCLRRRVAGLSDHVRTADLMEPDVDLKLNIEALDLPDASVDVILCSHVLEHVDDAKAIAELYRVLAPGGRLLAMVPMIDGWAQTYEKDAGHAGPERRLHFGRRDHVRRYGRDFLDRLSRRGFAVEAISASGPDAVRYGLMFGECVYVCRKAAG